MNEETIYCKDCLDPSCGNSDMSGYGYLGCGYKPKDPLKRGCVWKNEQDTNNWDTSCGNKFVLLCDSPSENEMKFCPYCGKTLIEGE